MRSVAAWSGRDADTPRAAPASQISASERLVRECLDGSTPKAWIDKCSQAIASAELTQSEKRGAYYVRGRAFEQIGDINEAEEDYRAVLRIKPDHAAAKARLEDLIAPAAPPNPMPPKRA